MVRLIGGITVPRTKLLEFKTQAFKQMLNGLLVNTKLSTRKIKYGLNRYLMSKGILPKDESIMMWLQENPGDTIGLFMFEIRPHSIGFFIKAGSSEELKRLGEQYGTVSNNTKRITGQRKIDMGQRTGVEKPRAY
jgi:hypothetical protein